MHQSFPLFHWNDKIIPVEQWKNMENLFKINGLQERYKLNSIQSIYDRINFLKIIPIKKGYLCSEQLKLMDALDKHIKNGGAMREFPIIPLIDEQKSLEKIEIDPGGLDNDIYLKTFEWMGKVTEQAISALSINNKSSLSGFEEIEKAIAHKWILPTSIIFDLIGFRPSGETCDRGSFNFEKVGRIGRESGWIITKK